MKTFIAILFLLDIAFTSVAQEVVQAEYFLDADAGFGQNKTVGFTPATDGSFSFTVDLSGVSPGFHSLYFRMKGSDGAWSHTSTRNIEVLASESINNIVSGEYYFDADPGFGAANNITISTPDSAILENFMAATASLSVGYHKLYGRLKDQFGNWSLTFSRNTEVIRTGDYPVTQVEYFFGSDAGIGINPSLVFANPVIDGAFEFTIPANQVPQNADTLFLRVSDNPNGNWSLTAYKVGQIVLPLTLLSFNGTVIKKEVALTWKTVNELNSSHFIIERSIDGTYFNAVGKVSARGNSTSLTDYAYQDDISAINTNKIYYRLQMADKDGSSRPSNVIVVKISDDQLLFTLRPNPTRNNLTIAGNRNGNNTILIIRNMAGQTLLKQKLAADATETVNISKLVKGEYIVSIVTPEKTYTEKLIVE
jgi:hypothetical protein